MKFDNLIKLRESLGMNQKEFAESLNLNKTTYNNYETGVREPRTDFFELVAKTYNISVDYLLGLTNTPTIHENLLNSYSSSEDSLIKKYRSLNENGKDKVNEYVGDLIENPKYINHEPNFDFVKQKAEQLSEFAQHLAPIKTDIQK